MTCHRALRSYLSLLTFVLLAASPAAKAQEGHELDPSAALTSALSAACKQNDAQFSYYLTADNSEAFRALPTSERIQVLKRISLAEDAGHALLSSDPQGRPILRCETPAATIEFHFGEAKLRENLAFIPLQVTGGEATEIGMVRERSSWRILSVGLLLFNIPALSRQWHEQDLAARDDAAAKTVSGLARAIETYRKAFGALPEALAQLGPPPKAGRSPDAADLIGSDLAAGERAGFHYRYRLVSASDGGTVGFELAATPATYAKTGKRSYFLDTSGKFHAADHAGAFATADDPTIPLPDLNSSSGGSRP